MVRRSSLFFHLMPIKVPNKILQRLVNYNQNYLRRSDVFIPIAANRNLLSTNFGFDFSDLMLDMG